MALFVAFMGARHWFEPVPRLQIALQGEGPYGYWHGTLAHGANQIEIRQLRVWLENRGNVPARQCRISMTITRPSLRGKDAPVAFALPVTLLYDWQHPPTQPFRAPDGSEVAIDIPANGREAFDVIHWFSTNIMAGDQACFPYHFTVFPLRPNELHYLDLTAHAEGMKPVTRRLEFIWDGTRNGLDSGVKVAEAAAH